MRFRIFLFVAVWSGLLLTDRATAIEWQVSYTNGNQAFSSIVCSADGKTIVASEPRFSAFYISTNSGASWTSNSAPFSSWFSVTCSADGSKVMANSTGGIIWMSSDSGRTWLSKPVPATNWFSIASSASGQIIVLSSRGGGWVYSSQDSATTWTSNVLSSTDEHSLACSADGRKMFASATPGGIYVSTNSGLTWQQTAAPTNLWWSAIACSANGTKVIAGNAAYLSQSTIQLYISTNSGLTWIPTTIPNAPQDCFQLVSSANGNQLVALLQPPVSPSVMSMFASTDSGSTWTPTGDLPPYAGWTSVAITADGYRINATAGLAPITFVGGGIYISKSVPHPLLSIAPNGAESILSWTIPSTDFVLQQSSSLAPTNWSNLAVQPAFAFTNLSYQVSFAPTGSPSFFRLEQLLK
jgi:hypothetical protein